MDPDPTFHPDGNPDPSVQIKAQTLENVLKQAHILYILACHLQINADPDPAYHLMWIRMRIWIRIFISCGCGFGSTALPRVRVSVPSSELAPPAQSPASECVPPLGGRGQHSLAGEGAGGANTDDWRESLALCTLRVVDPFRVYKDILKLCYRI